MDSINSAACKFGSDAWLELQAFKTRQLNRREKLKRHKNIHQDLISGIVSDQAATSNSNNQNLANSLLSSTETRDKQPPSGTPNDNKSAAIPSDQSSFSQRLWQPGASTPSNLDLVECLLLLKLCDVALKLPIDSKSLQLSICRRKGFENTTQSVVENLLQKFALQELITIDESTARPSHLVSKSKKTLNTCDEHKQFNEESCIYVVGADHTRLVEFDKSIDSNNIIRALKLESNDDSKELVVELDQHLYTNQAVSDHGIRSSELDSSFKIRPGLESCNEASDSLERQKREGPTSYSPSTESNTHYRNSTPEVKHRDDLESLLLLSSTKEKESKKLGEELLELLSKPTAKERDLLERFRSADGYQVQEFCPKGTKGECIRKNKGNGFCSKLHFKKIIAKHTEESLGDCSFLNTCFHMDSCKYVHYEVDYDDSYVSEDCNAYQFRKPQAVKPKKLVPSVELSNNRACKMVDNSSSIKLYLSDADGGSGATGRRTNSVKSPSNEDVKSSGIKSQNSQAELNKYVLTPEEQAEIEIKNRKRFKTVLYPPQWIQCDLRFFDMSLLGKFSVVMADPPWDIHMELPYGTMSDDEMRKLNIPTLQDEGVIFLWVTGRAMELGRECLALWGYERCDEIIWVKTNQLQRIIRTGRTGHWLNHGKEHCLVGVKGNPKDINRGLDCDVIVAEVRATSHKPDEIYGIIERLSPGTRKIELFGRAHNVQPNWITLGNQLNGVQLIDPNLVNAFKKLNLPFQTAEHLTPS